jgi:hypothetical protein
MFQGRAWLPDESSLWPSILDHAHTTGHEGSEKTLHHVRAAFYNPHARRMVREFVRSCTMCQKNKTEHLHPAGLLQPLPVPAQYGVTSQWTSLKDF